VNNNTVSKFDIDTLNKKSWQRKIYVDESAKYSDKIDKTFKGCGFKLN